MAASTGLDDALILAAQTLTWTAVAELDETSVLTDEEAGVARRVLAAIRAEGTVTAEEMNILDSTLLTQYVRGEQNDEMGKWESQLRAKITAGLLLRGRGIYDVDTGATMFPKGFTYVFTLTACSTETTSSSSSSSSPPPAAVSAAAPAAAAVLSAAARTGGARAPQFGGTLRRYGHGPPQLLYIVFQSIV